MRRFPFYAAILFFGLICATSHCEAFNALDSDAMRLLQQPSQDEYGSFLTAVRGVSGVSWFVLALIACQGFFLLFRTVFGEILGAYQLLVLAVLSLFTTIGVNLMAGKTVVESVFLDAGTLMAYQVLMHQAKRQWEKRAEDREQIDMLHRIGRRSRVRKQHAED